MNIITDGIKLSFPLPLGENMSANVLLIQIDTQLRIVITKQNKKAAVFI